MEGRVDAEVGCGGCRRRAGEEVWEGREAGKGDTFALTLLLATTVLMGQCELASLKCCLCLA